MDGRQKIPQLPDSAARRAALTDLNRTLLVEAGAGSGKTALLAGRVALLVGAGIHPKNIVAITFTEAAAAELLERIEQVVRDLLSGTIPPELAEALPDGLAEEQADNLQEGARVLDEIACTTIHGFCQQLIKPYAVETGLDPGAAIIDPAAAELAYQDLMDAWLSARFGRDRGAEGLGRIPPIGDSGGAADFFAELLLQAPDGTLELIRQTAQFLKVHRTARTAGGDGDNAVFGQYADVVDGFSAWYHACGVSEPVTAELIDDLARVADILRAAMQQPLTGLVPLLFHKPPSACKSGSMEFKQWRAKGRWASAAKAVGRSVAQGQQLSAAGETHYQACAEAYGALCAELGGRAFERFIAEFDVLRDLYRDYKRNAALLDFDDLLYQARDLLRNNRAVRVALAHRYPRILVDEFQDTDPVQAEILWRLAGDGDEGAAWHEYAIRPGALFLVGDPKQAIYRFRGADVQTYLTAKRALSHHDPASVLDISANFRTRAPILDYVNRHFESMLDVEQGQPGFTALSATRRAGDASCIEALDITLDDTHKTAKGALSTDRVRREEAAVVADAVQRLIGAFPVWDKNEGQSRPARAGDIALLAPTGTSLWIYEQALERCEIPIATQAGKGFFRRQEVQDLIAIARAIADSRDTLALGALLRGPLVGLTEEQIADEIEALRNNADHDVRLNLWTDPADVGEEVLRRTLTVMQNLARKVRGTTPFHLLAEAVEELHVRSILKARHPRGAERALANVELVLEMARTYAGRGVGDFARALWQRWDDGDAQAEGRPDAEADAVSITTMHSAKGLEWPVVIPVNSMTRLWSDMKFLYRRWDNSVHFKIFGFPSPDFLAVHQEESDELSRERIRLWYVALTRARDLLLLPRQSERGGNDWFSLMDIDVKGLPGFDGTQFLKERTDGVALARNLQDSETWEREAAAIAANQQRITWHRPSRHEETAEPVDEPVAVYANAVEALETTSAEAVDPDVRGGLQRGLVLHKLMEEVLTGETADDTAALQARAAECLAQLGLVDVPDASEGQSSVEMAATVERTLRLPEIIALRPRLVPEFPVYAGATAADNTVSLTAGIADAVALDEDGGIDVVVDWKSDVDPGARQVELYRQQVRDYLQATSARSGIIVFLGSGRIENVTALT